MFGDNYSVLFLVQLLYNEPTVQVHQLFRFNPNLALEGKNPFKLDSKAPSIPVTDYMSKETRFNMLAKSNPAEAARLAVLSQQHVDSQYQFYTRLEKLFGEMQTDAKVVVDTAVQL